METTKVTVELSLETMDALFKLKDRLAQGWTRHCDYDQAIRMALHLANGEPEASAAHAALALAQTTGSA